MSYLINLSLPGCVPPCSATRCELFPPPPPPAPHDWPLHAGGPGMQRGWGAESQEVMSTAGITVLPGDYFWLAYIPGVSGEGRKEVKGGSDRERELYKNSSSQIS